MAAAPDYGPEGGVVSGMDEEEMRDHVEMLLHRMQDEEPGKQLTAGVAMALYIGDQRFLPEGLEAHPAAVLSAVLFRKKTSREEKLNCVRALAIMGPHAAPYASSALAKMMSSSNFELKWETVRAIRAFGPPAAEGDSGIPEALARALIEEEAATLRYDVACALAALGPGAASGAAEALAQAMEEDDTDVQNTSAKALGVMGPAAAVPPVIEALVKAVHHGSFELKRRAVDALAAMGVAAGGTAPVLARLLRPTPSGDPVLRVRAAEALGQMGRALIREQQLWLSQAVGDPEESVRNAAKATLQIAGCKRALKGSMYLQDPETDDEQQPTGLLALGDSQAASAAVEAAASRGMLDKAAAGSRSSSRSSGSRSSSSTPESLVAP